MSVNLLSSEIMVMIFSYLKPMELQNVMKVCHSWRCLATDRKLWNRTNIDCYGKAKTIPVDYKWVDKFNVDEFLWLFKHGVKITRLNLDHCSAQETKSVINSCIKYEMPLSELHLGMSTEIDWETVNDLATSPVGANITDIYVGLYTTLPSLYHFAKFPNLQTFDYWGSNRDELLQVLATHFCSLREVHLNEEQFVNLDMKKMLHNIKGLKKVSFITCYVEEDVGFQAFSGNQSIEEIDVKHTWVIGDTADVRFIDYQPLVTLPNLKTLSFDFNRTKHSTLRLLQIATKSIASLEFRNLPDNSDHYNTDELLALIARRFTHLHTLNIQLNCGTDSGLFAFLREAVKLRKLVIDNSGYDYFNLFGDNDPNFRKLTGDKWSNVIGSHPALKELDLHQCDFLTKENVDILKVTCKSSGIKVTLPWKFDAENNT